MSGREHPLSARHADGSNSESSSTERTIDVDELLSLLGDEYTREILSTLGDESLPAREIADRSTVSRPTVYRRLNRLEEMGIVETVLSLHPDGQHRKSFTLVVDELELSFEGDTMAVTAENETEPAEEAASPAGTEQSAPDDGARRRLAHASQ